MFSFIYHILCYTFLSFVLFVNCVHHLIEEKLFSILLVLEKAFKGKQTESKNDHQIQQAV